MGAFVRVFGIQEGAGFVRGGDKADDVEVGAAEEGGVAGLFGGGDGKALELGVDVIVDEVPDGEEGCFLGIVDDGDAGGGGDAGAADDDGGFAASGSGDCSREVNGGDGIVVGSVFDDVGDVGPAAR